MKKIGKYLALLIVLLGAFWSLPPGMHAKTDNRAALVVRFSDELTETACVEFEEPQISGFDLIVRSDLNIEIEAQGLGALVCRVNDTGCPASDCLCQCRGGGDCIYWSYWHQLQDGWQYSQAGSTVYQVEPGAVEGWSWGPGAVNLAVPPVEITFEEVCQSPATDTPTPSPSPTVTNTTAAIVITPMATATRNSSVSETAVPDAPTATATIEPTKISTMTVTETPLPLRQVTATSPVEITPTQDQIVQPIFDETPRPSPQTEADKSTNQKEERLPFTPTVSTSTVTNEPLAVAANQMVELTREKPPAMEPNNGIAAVAVEPINQLTVIGSGFVSTNEGVEKQQQSLVPEKSGINLADWVPYLVFLMILGGLGVILVVTTRRRKSSGMH